MNATQSPTVQRHVAALVAKGYRRISNKYGMVARIDRPDWIEVLPANFKRNANANAADYYRRCVSKDVLELPTSVAMMVPNSDNDAVGFVA